MLTTPGIFLSFSVLRTKATSSVVVGQMFECKALIAATWKEKWHRCWSNFRREEFTEPEVSQQRFRYFLSRDPVNATRNEGGNWQLTVADWFYDYPGVSGMSLSLLAMKALKRTKNGNLILRWRRLTWVLSAELWGWCKWFWILFLSSILSLWYGMDADRRRNGLIWDAFSVAEMNSSIIRNTTASTSNILSLENRIGSWS